MLAHFAPILVQDVSKTEDRLIRALVEHEGANCHQRVEPATGLIDRFADEVGRICGSEFLFGSGYVRVPPLCERHCPRVVPAVDHFRHSTHLFSALSAWEEHVIDKGSMRVEGGQVHVGQIPKLA
ncbi:hypothetical protein GALL_479210 [mine drainage metagenome]|uniref:Uncharacterized protein n=1 Tax=mine drainage metagenome TaxID=410659 RepID=A0A1J5PYW4_9ZZZZ